MKESRIEYLRTAAAEQPDEAMEGDMNECLDELQAAAERERGLREIMKSTLSCLNDDVTIEPGSIAHEEIEQALTESELPANLLEAKLKEFARAVIKAHCWGIIGDKLDGFEMQELAEKLDLIESHTVTAEEADDMFEAGDTSFVFTAALTESETT